MIPAGRLALVVAACAMAVLPLARAERLPKAPSVASYLDGYASRAGEALAFIDSYHTELYIRRGNAPPVALTHANEFPARSAVHSFSWSPDGKRIAFCREGERWAVYVINVDGSGLKRLAPGCYPVWSPDGRRIAYVNGGTDSYSTPIWVVHANGGPVRRATRPGAPGAFTHVPERTPLTWAPGRQVVFESGQAWIHGVYKLNPDTRNEVKLSPRGSTSYWAAWSPNGRLIAYVQSPHGYDIREIHVVTPAGYDRTLTAGHDDDLPIWTPDGSHLVFDHHPAGTTVNATHTVPTNLYTISIAAGSHPHALTDSERRQWFP